MNKLKRIQKLRKSIEIGDTNKEVALEELQYLLNIKDINTLDNDEYNIYLQELTKLKTIKKMIFKSLKQTEVLENNSNDIKNILNLNDEELAKIKSIAYNLL